MDPTFLSRVQYGVHSAVHYMFPPMTIGLGLLLVFMEGMFVFTKNPVWEKITRYWVKVFALIFALGVATGIIQVFGLGTNWARFSRYVGDIFGGILGAEAIFAFTLEAGFLGILLFGWNKVGPKTHFISTIFVMIGAHLSAFWIVCANSWMQTPAGHRIVGEGANARAELVSYWGALFNPSSLTRLGHVYLGCWIAGTFLVISVSAYYLLKNKHLELAKKSLKLALWVGSIAIILQGLSGDDSGRGISEWQPAKLAAFEGIYKTQEYTPMYIFGSSNPDTGEVRGLKIPGLLSFLVYHDWKTPVVGLDQFPKEDWPVTKVVFQTYHLMITFWAIMFFIVIWAIIKAFKKTLFTNSRWLWRVMVISVLFPQIANLCGWLSAEMGRQPWAVYNLLRTANGTSPMLSAQQVLGSLIMLVVIFTLLLFVFIFLLDRKIKHGPVGMEEENVDPYRDAFKARGV